MRISRLAAIAAAALVASPAVAQLADTGFDAQGGSVTDFCYIQSNCPTGIWTGGGAGFARPPSFGVPSAVSSPEVLFVQGTGGIQQIFTANATGVFRLSWWDAGRPDGGTYAGNETYTVTLYGPSSVVFQTSISTTSGRGWARHVSTPFPLTAGASYTLVFAGQTAADQTSFIDSLTLGPASEARSYSYDALGRLIGTSEAGVLNMGLQSATDFDAADNRRAYSVSGGH